MKWEIEDYCFRYLYPYEYKYIAHLLDERRIEREQYITNFVTSLSKKIKKHGVRASVYGRPKHIYSIWLKMQRKLITFNELFDLLAVRIVAEHIQDCYGVLSTVHALYCHLPNEFDDYIENPKPNGYQSIHTVVLGPQGKAVEIQIRTYQMHKTAELGLAAHWKYKKMPIYCNHFRSIEIIEYEKSITWLHKLINWEKEIFNKSKLLRSI
ncbi:hypothetical protein [Pantoea sp. Aalb]|uniref:hypothetical protein n=1 Tax=Pantoea sp. Aalb TaxID=2576762 RepID=UPI001F34E17F|nr:hypothetical protein [Pantoea sp. Aalb]